MDGPTNRQDDKLTGRQAEGHPDGPTNRQTTDRITVPPTDRQTNEAFGERHTNCGVNLITKKQILKKKMHQYCFLDINRVSLKISDCI